MLPKPIPQESGCVVRLAKAGSGVGDSNIWACIVWGRGRVAARTLRLATMIPAPSLEELSEDLERHPDQWGYTVVVIKK